MAIPLELREELNEPAFWARYTFAHEDGPGSDRLGDLVDELEDEFDDLGDGEDEDTGIEVRFEVGGGHAIVLFVDNVIDSHELGLTGPEVPAPTGEAAGAGEVGELGWDDLAHWHPFALRWAELDLICRAVGVAEPDLAHPGAPLALLCRFAAVFEDDDVDQAVAAVDAAFESLRPAHWSGFWPRGTDWLERADFRGHGVRWERDEAGHRWAEQRGEQKKGFYSTRTARPGEGVFPHERLRALLDAANLTAGEAGADGGNGTNGRVGAA